MPATEVVEHQETALSLFVRFVRLNPYIDPADPVLVSVFAAYRDFVAEVAGE